MAGTVVQQVKLLPAVSACSMAAAPLPDSETQVGDPDEARGYRGPLWSKQQMEGLFPSLLHCLSIQFLNLFFFLIIVALYKNLIHLHHWDLKFTECRLDLHKQMKKTAKHGLITEHGKAG